MPEKIKVYNPQKFDVGVALLDKPLGINIKAGSFVKMTEDDVSYITSISTLFQRGILRVEEASEDIVASAGIDAKTDPNFIDDEDIRKKLNLSAKKIEEWLDTVTEEYVLDRIYDVAKDMNLNVSKIKVLQEKMPERNFME